MERSRISVIVPVYNEVAEIDRTLAAARAGHDVEVIVVDGGSVDGSADLARRSGVPVLEVSRHRARQMNAGAATASGRHLLFLHADTRLPEGYDREVRSVLARPGVVAGAFRLSIDAPGRSMRLIERGANWRALWLGLPYGDQTIFLETECFRRIGGYPDLPFMEDFELVRRLRRAGRIELAPGRVRTSARRWLELGILRATLINQLVVAGYLVGVDPARLAARYRRGKLL